MGIGDGMQLANLRCSLFRERAEALQFLVQLALGGVLENQVDPVLVIEVAVQPENVRMPDATRAEHAKEPPGRFDERAP